MHSAWKAWQQSGRRRSRSRCSNFERQTAQSPSPQAVSPAEDRRVMEENVNNGSESMMEGEGISGETRRPEENTGVEVAVAGIALADEDGDRRRRQRRLRWRRSKQRARERVTVMARTITIMRMLGLRLCRADER